MLQLWGTKSPRPPTKALFLDITGDFRPPGPVVSLPAKIYQKSSTGNIPRWSPIPVLTAPDVE